MSIPEIVDVSEVGKAGGELEAVSARRLEDGSLHVQGEDVIRRHRLLQDPAGSHEDTSICLEGNSSTRP